jgi:hypothetical protein
MQQVETFQEYLAARRTQSTNGSVHGGSAQRAPNAMKMTRSHLRAIKNWKRAKYAVTKKITQDMLGVQRRCVVPPFLCMLNALWRVRALKSLSARLSSDASRHLS